MPLLSDEIVLVTVGPPVVQAGQVHDKPTASGKYGVR
jgi:hypothetical protein